jgi:hypothetical protein
MAGGNSNPRKGKVTDLTGQRFGFLTVECIDSIRKRSDGRGTKVFWKCLCDCGQPCVCESSRLTCGVTKSCGCLKLASHNATHGQSKTRLYYIWVSMKARCCNPRNHAFADYGGRGIVVCSEWRDSFESFRDWAIGAGYSNELTLDRYPNQNGNYEPSNCRWATWPQQQRNRRNTRYVEYEGKRVPLAALAESAGIRVTTLHGRLESGWDLGIALATPVATRSPTDVGE